MLITKYTHACVRLEDAGRVLVIDPGEWSEPEALTGADAVLVTHEHSDHIDTTRLAEAGLPIFAPAGADMSGVDVTRVSSGQQFEAAGFRIKAVGSRHAFIDGDEPDCPNLGYVVEDRNYHPGDAFRQVDQAQPHVPHPRSRIEPARPGKRLGLVRPGHGPRLPLSGSRRDRLNHARGRSRYLASATTEPVISGCTSHRNEWTPAGIAGIS